MQTYTLSACIMTRWSLLFKLNGPILLQIILPGCDVSATMWNIIDKWSNYECAAWWLHVKSYSRCAHQLPAHNRCNGDIAAEDVFTRHLTLVHVRSWAHTRHTSCVTSVCTSERRDDRDRRLIYISCICLTVVSRHLCIRLCSSTSADMRHNCNVFSCAGLSWSSLGSFSQFCWS